MGENTGSLVSMEWDGYEVYDPGVFGPLDELPRRDARRAFNRLMEQGPVREDNLRRLLAANGVELGDSDEAVQALNDWFVANVEPHPELSWRLRPIWYSVVNDVALFLGDVMIERHPSLRWEFFTWGRTDASYQRHVLMGFGGPNHKDNVDVDIRVAWFGHFVVMGREDVGSAFLTMFRQVAAMVARAD